MAGCSHYVDVGSFGLYRNLFCTLQLLRADAFCTLLLIARLR